MHRVLTEWARTLRFGRGWVTGRGIAEAMEVSIDRGDRTVPATLYVPPRLRRPLPGWVVLHGITRPGRAHPSLVRFARALAATPAAVLVPEIPEWRALDLSPETAVPTIQAAVLALDARPETTPGRTGLMGFSFGAPQAIVASTDPRLDGHLAAVVGFGGYCDLARTVRFQFSGRHEWKGRTEHLDPDPYGRWIVGANYLTRVPGHGDADDVARALHALAAEAGDRGAMAGDPIYDPSKLRLRGTVASGRRDLFDLFAPPSGVQPDRARGEALAEALARAAASASPGLDPVPALPRVRTPVRLVHGLRDELIPYTETLRLASAFPPGTDVTAFVTGLFAHSRGHDGGTMSVRYVREAVRFLDGIRKALGPV